MGSREAVQRDRLGCKKYIVAVSGGVDSVVMLDMLAKSGAYELVVAHFDHGIRPDSGSDARFVAELAAKYGVPFELGEGNLGESASEEQARNARYAFLYDIAKKHDGRIATAHHHDDVIETIAINLTRGTGWRGLAVLNSAKVERPMLEYRKHELHEYALRRNLEWVEDETNQTDIYLRNRTRRQLGSLSEEVRKALGMLWLEQRVLAKLIDYEAEELHSQSRYFMSMIDEPSAVELLRGILAKQSLGLTRPQRLRLLHAIKTARPGTTFEAGQGVHVAFTRDKFIVKHP